MSFVPPSPTDIMEPGGFVPPEPSDILPERTEFEETTVDESTLEFPPEEPKGSKVFKAAMQPMISGDKIMEQLPGHMILKKGLEAISKEGGKVGKSAKTALGVLEGGEDLVGSLTSPVGIATLGTGVLPRIAQKVAGVAFGAHMASQVPEVARQAGETSVTGTERELARSLVGLGGQIAFPGMIGAHLVSRAPTPRTPPGIRTEPATPSPELIQAVRERRIVPPEPVIRADLPPIRVAEEPFIPREADILLPSAAKELRSMAEGGTLERVQPPGPSVAPVRVDPTIPISIGDILGESIREGRIVEPPPIQPVEPSVPIPEPQRLFPSGLDLLREQSMPGMIQGEIPANMGMVELLGDRMPGMQIGLERLGQIARRERPQAPITFDEPIRVPEPKSGPFIVDERGITVKVQDRFNPTKEEIARIKASASLPENAIALSERIGDEYSKTIFVDENGNAVVGPLGRESGTPIELTLPERLKSEEAINRKINEEIQAFQNRFETEATKEKLLSAEEMAERRTGGTIPEGTPLKPSWEAALERWADDAIKEGQSRLSIGLDPKLLAAYAVKGAFHLSRGITDIAKWTAEMVKEFGEGIRPHISTIRNSAEKIRAESFKVKPEQASEGPTPPQIDPALTGPKPPPLPVEVKNLYPTDTPFPDHPPTPQSKEIHTQKFGVERIPVIGRLFSMRGNIKDEIDRVLVTFFGEKGVGNSIMSAFGEEISGTLDKHFGVVTDKKSKIRGQVTLIPIPEGKSRYLGDVLEELQRNPDAYPLTPEQRDAFNRSVQYQNEMNKLEDRYDLFQDEIGEYVPGKPSRKESYVPRQLIESPKKDKSGPIPGGFIGLKPGFLKGRKFDLEASAAIEGYFYEPSLEKRLVTRGERLYNAIAEKRLFNDPALGGKTPNRIESELRQYYADELGSGEITESQLMREVERIKKEGTVHQPGFFSKVYDRQVAERLNKAFPRADSSWRKRFVNVNNALKGLRLGFDLGAAFIQGQVTLFNNPQAWGKGVANSIKALGDNQALSTYARENTPYIRELAQLGVEFGRLSEMLSGLQKGELLTRIPVVGPAARTFGRSFQSFLDVSKVELWKSIRETLPKDKWREAAQAIESQIGSGRMESIGVVGKRSLAERALLLAPSYYRGALNQISQIGQSGVSGNMARRSMTAYLAGGAALFYGIGLMLDMDEEEIQKRFDPTRSDFMMWDVEGSEGRTLKVGPGGIYRSLIRLMGNVTKTALENPGNFSSLTSEKNPFVRWYRGHAAPIPGLSWDAFTGRDFLGGETDVGTLMPSLAPLPLQELVRKEGEPPVTGKELGASFFGLSSFPSPISKEKEKAREETSEGKFGKDYKELNLMQMLDIAREVDKRQELKPKVTTPRQRELAYKADIERQNRIKKGVPKSKEIESLGLTISGYEPSLSIAGSTIQLPKERIEDYEKMIIEEYNRLLNDPVMVRLRALPFERRQDFLNRVLTQAREVAKARLIQKMR